MTIRYNQFTYSPVEIGKYTVFITNGFPESVFIQLDV